jgi:hypothetical protein
MKITDKTSIPIFLVAGSVPAFIGGIMWLSFIAYTSDTAAKDVVKIKSEQKEVNQEIKVELKEIRLELSEISQRQIRMEEQMRKKQ